MGAVMKKLALLLMLISGYANALCLTSYLDEEGQFHTIRCGGDTPEEKCSRMVADRSEERVYMNGGMYWNGKSCEKVKVIEICEKQGGKWIRVSLLKRPPASINTCVCPDDKVWDGKKCRSDIPVLQQCIGHFDSEVPNDPKIGSGYVRMTEGVYGSKNCPRVTQMK